MADEDQDNELDEFFGEESETEVEETEVEDESEVESEEETETEESEDESDTENESETTAEKETETLSKKDAGFKQAYLAEKEKRQKLEERVGQLEEQFLPKEEELPDPYEDREGYEQALRQRWEREQAEKSEKARLQKIEDKRVQMMEEKEDFLEMEKIFELLSVRDTSIRNEMFEASDPVEYAYNKASEYYNEVMKPEKVLTTEMPDTSELDEPDSKSKSKPNLAKATASKSNKVEVEQDDTLEDIFADQEY